MINPIFRLAKKSDFSKKSNFWDHNVQPNNFLAVNFSGMGGIGVLRCALSKFLKSKASLTLRFELQLTCHRIFYRKIILAQSTNTIYFINSIYKTKNEVNHGT
jgi:hypothetical protein